MNSESWFSITNAAALDAEISIYGPIGGAVSAVKFCNDLKKVQARSITLRIHSPGGAIFEGHAIFNALQRHPANVTTVIDGLAASMATVIALAGSKVKMAANGMWMIHNPNGSTAGGAKDMRDLAAILEKLTAQIIDVYAAKTGKPRAEISALMDAETWMNAEEAKAFGFVDEILPAKKATASIYGDFDLTAFAHPPARPAGDITALLAENSRLAIQNRALQRDKERAAAHGVLAPENDACRRESDGQGKGQTYGEQCAAITNKAEQDKFFAAHREEILAGL